MDLTHFKNPIICAIDTCNIKKASDLIEEIHPYVGGIKLGLEFFTMNGPEGIKKLSKHKLPIFLDLKFLDIPNTVAKSICNCIKLNVDILTIHASGGSNMVKAAAEAARKEADILKIKKPLIAGVTILTSMDEKDCKEVGYNNISNQVKNLANISYKNGLDSIVCSPKEIELIRESFGKELVIITPGIRPVGKETDDQKRVMTPKEAIKKGANLLVIGRPITQSELPSDAAKNILDSIY